MVYYADRLFFDIFKFDVRMKTIDNCLDCEYVVNCRVYNMEVNYRTKDINRSELITIIEKVQKDLGNICQIGKYKRE